MSACLESVTGDYDLSAPEGIRLEAAWAAGLFDGEGSIVVTASGKIKLQMKMVDHAALDRFARIVAGPNRVLGPYGNRMEEKDGHPRRDYYMWVSRTVEAEQILGRFWPYLSEVRRARAVEAGFDPMTFPVKTDEPVTAFRVCDVESARTLLSAVEGLRSWVTDHDQQRAAYDAATPAERDAVLGLTEEDEPEPHEVETGYALDDPKHPDYLERMVD